MHKLIPAIAFIALAAGIFLFVTRDTTPPAPVFADYPAGDARKQAFFDYFAPIIAEENAKVLEWREKVEGWQNSGGPGQWQRSTLENLTSNYFMKDFNRNDPEDWNALLKRIDIVPVSLALAQAAKESGWGTSRFAVSANNYFGEWCFAKGCGVVPENRNSGATHEVASFDNPADSVRSYLRNLNRHRAYAAFRELRAEEREKGSALSGLSLAGGLSEYSERGPVYVEELRSMIRHNELEPYDECNTPC